MREENEPLVLLNQSSALWFNFCCLIYKKYGEKYWSRQREGLGAPTLDHIDFLSSGSEWILHAVANSFTVYARVAYSIETAIKDHWKGITTTLNEKNSDDHWYNNGDLTYAVGAFKYPDKFNELLESDANLSVLREAMVEKPS
eukprot:7005841-Prymnesium_polylepis.1